MITRSFPSSSSSAVYTAMITDADMLSCDCRGWTMLRAGKPRHCKHTKALAEGRQTEVRGDYVFVVGSAPATPAARVATAAAASAGPPLPMLASAMVEPVTGAAFDARFADGWAMEEKLDGHRCLAVVTHGGVTAFGRPRRDSARIEKRLPPNVVEQLRRFPVGVYDGELVEVGGGKSWDVTVVGAQLAFVAFDVVEVLGESLARWRYADRREALLEVLRAMPKEQTAVSTVRSLTPTWAGVEAIWAKGGEGAILKRVDSTYRPGHRSPDWVKVKAVRAATLTIVGFEEGKNGPHARLKLSDGAGTVTTIKTPDNATLRAIAKAPRTFIGRRVVISFQERTPSGSFRHPMFDHFAGEGE